MAFEVKELSELSHEDIDALMEQIKEGREDPEFRVAIDHEYDRHNDRLLSRGKLSGEKASIVGAHIDKYMKVLGIEGERPDVRLTKVEKIPDYIREREGKELTGHVAGTTHWHPMRPYTSVITIPKSLFKRPLALEGTIAHELVHHRNNLAVTDDEIRKFFETGNLPDWLSEAHGHGKVFQEGAERVNAVMGPDYVKPEGMSEKEEEEWEQVSEKEALQTAARRNSVRFALKALVAVGGGLLLGAALKRFSQKFLDRAPATNPVTSRTNTRGNYGSPKPPTPPSANARGTYGSLQRSSAR